MTRRPRRRTQRRHAPHTLAASDRQTRAYGPWAAAVFGAFWFWWQFDSIVPGPSTLWPTHIDWLMRPDWDQHYLGSCFARLSADGVFSNNIPSLLPGLGTTVGLVDANPWVTFILKLLHPVLPMHFQLIGLWLCANFALLGVMGAQMAALWRASQRVQALCGALLATSPILLHRVGHDSLCAHWVIVAMFWCLLKSAQTAGQPRYAWGWPSTLMIFVAGLHPYLAGILAPLYIASLGQAAALKPTRQQAVKTVLVGLVTVGLCYFAVVWGGFLGAGASPQGDLFGAYSSNLLTLVDPRGWSQTLRTWPRVPLQDEGFGFLGLGSLTLVGMGAWLAVWRRRAGATPRLWGCIMAIAAAEMLYAVGPHMMLADTLVYDWGDKVPGIMPYLSVFRASGRFIWAAHYALWAWALGLCLTRLPRAWHGPVIAGLLIAQLWDLTPEGVVLQRTRPTHTTPPLTHAMWRTLQGDYDDLVMVPPSFQMHERACPMQPVALGTWTQLARIAYENHLTFNSAPLSRANEAALSRYCQDLQGSVAAQTFKARTVYAVSDGYLPAFVRGQSDIICAPADRWHLCVHGDRATKLTAAMHSKLQAAAL